MHYPLKRETFISALGVLCQLNRIPFQQELVLRQFPPPYDVAGLRHALKALGLKTAFKKISPHKLPAATLPCLALLKAEVDDAVPAPASSPQLTQSGQPAPDAPSPGNHAAESEAAAPTHKLALILQSDGERLLVLEPGQQTPQPVTVAEFARHYEGHALLAKKPSEDAPDHEAAPRRFGFRWFIPELLKYRRIWSEVLLASFAIQLVGLAVPICTQIVIDKVVVHHTMSTLVVIALALLAFLVFNAAMGWVRQYLVLHTGNRIDATLGHRVFSHLLELPLRYYEHRPTGIVVARVHGVETIREFLAGGLVTLLLDFPFLIVFLAIMFWYSWQLTLISVAGLVLISILSIAVTPMIRARLNQQFLLGARNQAFLTEYISGMETVKSLQLEPQLKTRFGGYLADYLAASFKSRTLSNSYNTFANAIDQTQTLAILCVGAWLVMRNANFTVGMLVAFQMFSGRLSGPVLRLVGLWQEFQQADIAVKRLGDVMNAPAEPYSIVPSRAASQHAKIEVEGISFRYSEHHPVLYQNLGKH